MTVGIVPGVYRHFRAGELFVVLGMGTDRTNVRNGAKVVIYYSVTTGGIETRELGEFLQKVRQKNGTLADRFELVTRANTPG